MLNMPKDEFIEQSLPLVHFVAKQFLKRAHVLNVEYDDLFSIGCVGLMKAYNRFDPDKGFQFSTYAVPLIQGEILRYFRDDNLLKIPRFEKELAAKIRRHHFENKPANVITDYFGCSTDLTERALAALQIKVTSADLPITPEGKTLKDVIPQQEDFSTVILQDFLLRLTDRERIVVLFRMEGSTQREIGQRIGISQAQIGRMLGRIAQKLTRYVEAG